MRNIYLVDMYMTLLGRLLWIGLGLCCMISLMVIFGLSNDILSKNTHVIETFIGKMEPKYGE